MEGQRVLARDDALRRWRRDLSQPLLDMMYQRGARYEAFTHALVSGDGDRARQEWNAMRAMEPFAGLPPVQSLGSREVADAMMR